MNAEYCIFIGVFCGIALPDQTRSQTKFSLTEEKGSGKQEGKKQVPTFVGSDGVVRKVSPASILDEMKRCLPPGLPIPIATAWPELPPHLEELQEAKAKNEPQDEGLQNLTNLKNPEDSQKISQEKRRVSRSNDKIGEMVEAQSDQSMNVKLEGPRKESSIFSPKSLDQNKMAEVLKDMLSRQMRRHNLTAEYIDDFSVRPRLHKPKLDEYEDYDYIDPEEPKTATRAKIKQGGRYSTNSFKTPTKRLRKSKRINRWRHSQRKTAERRQLNALRKKPDYDYDYEESNEDVENHQDNKHRHLQPTTIYPKSEDHIQSEELEKQIELNDFLEKNLNTNDGITERMENVDKFVKRGHFKTRTGENMDILEGYQKMLAVIMKLNTTLIRLLDKFSTIFQKGLPKTHRDSAANQNEDSGKSSVIWDFMDLLMQQRRGARSKRENSPCLPETKTNVEALGDPISALDETQAVIVKSSSGRTNMDLLKWLLKWYLTATSR